jgi:RNA polymerase sigma-70 factor (ECF subfamily)
MQQSGEVTAFCQRVQPRLLGALTLHCGDPAVAEELTQETLAVVWDKWSRVQMMAAPEAWALRVGFNMANSWLRRRIAERRALRRLGPGDQHHDLPQDSGVRDAVVRLPPRQRTAVVLRYFADLSVEQTADAMGCAPGTVKALTHQGITSLRGDLSLRDVEEEASHGH